MFPTPRTLEYAPAAPRERWAMMAVRLAIIAVGILLPYFARLPGAYLWGPQWLTSYLEAGFFGLILIGGFNAIVWVAILAGTVSFSSATAVVVAAVVGFALPAYGHATLDLSADAQAAIALVFIPIYSVPFVFLGLLIGLGVDFFLRRRAARK